MKKLILFIHGLGGAPHKTWENFPKLIEKDNDLSQMYDIGYYSFPTSLFRLPFQKKYPKIQHLADGLKTQIKYSFADYHEIALVCHSLGGLIAKKYLLEETKCNNQSHVRKILLYATPNNGSNLAAIADLVTFKHNQLKQLCKDSDFVESLNEDWYKLNISAKVQVKYVVAALDKVVDYHSAKSFWGNPDTETVNKSHRNVVKPNSINDLSFKILKDSLLSPTIQEKEERLIKKSLREHLNRQIEKQKRMKKYIPEVFTEITDIKERARYFVDPGLFWYKIIKDLKRLDFREIINFLEEYEIGVFDFSLPKMFEDIFTLEEIPSMAMELKQFLEHKIEDLEALAPMMRRDEKVIEKVPESKRYFFDHKSVYLLPGGIYFFTSKLKSIIKCIESFISKVIILTAPAGHGKTNFLCDFAENVLLTRPIGCMFFTANELNNIDLNNIGEFFLKLVLKSQYEKGWVDFLKDYRRIYESEKKPLLIVIDALNEHREIQTFSEKLLQFTEEVLSWEFIRVIYTCRSEYFKERFSKFSNASISSNILFIQDFDKRIRDQDRDNLLNAYFSFYKIRYNHMNREVYRRLTDDPLMLRIFCEAFADVEGKKEIGIGNLSDLYKESIFRLYLKKKEEELNFKRLNKKGFGIQRSRIFRKVLKSIIQYMLNEKKFVDVLIEALKFPADELDELARIIDEDILLRKDIKPEENKESALYSSKEVINFTFDEFRDFLIADELVFNVLKRSCHDFEVIIDDILMPQIPVSEGISKYLFYISKRLNNELLNKIIENKGWYKKIFVQEIFAVDDKFIKANDISKVKERFMQGRKNSSFIIYKLLFRHDTIQYQNLNITLLFDLLKDIDEDSYNELIAPVFKRKDNFSSFEPYAFSIDGILDEFKSILKHEDFDVHNQFYHLFEFLILMLGAEWDIADEVNELLQSYIAKYIEQSTRILLTYIRSLKIPGIVLDLYSLMRDLIIEGKKIPIDILKDLVEDSKKKLSKKVWSRLKIDIMDLLQVISNVYPDLLNPKELEIFSKD